MTTFVGTKMKPFTLITLFFWGMDFDDLIDEVQLIDVLGETEEFGG